MARAEKTLRRDEAESEDLPVKIHMDAPANMNGAAIPRSQEEYVPHATGARLCGPRVLPRLAVGRGDGFAVAASGIAPALPVSRSL